MYSREYYDDMMYESMTQGQYMGEAVREHARNVGAQREDVEWILTPFDTWERNPYYTGEPTPHPD